MQSQGGEQLLVFTDMSNILANFDNSAVTGVVNGYLSTWLGQGTQIFWFRCGCEGILFR